MAIEFFTVEIGRVGHRKWRALAKLGHVREAAATALWLAMMERCSEAQNGGRVPASWPSRDLPAWPLEVVTQAARDLVELVLLEEHPEGGWQIHDFRDHQHPLLAARAEEEPQTDDDEPPAGLSPEERKRWLGRQRARRWRASKRDANGSQRDGQRDGVTTERDAMRDGKRDGDPVQRDGERDENGPSVTVEASRRNAKTSRSVTLSGGPRHASPFFSTEEIEINSDAGAREQSESVTSNAPSRVTRHADRHAEEETERDASEGLTSGFVELVRAALAKGYRERDLPVPPECKLGTSHHQRLVVIARSLETQENLDACVRGFFGDPKTASEGYPMVWLERNPARYVQAGRGSQMATGGAGAQVPAASRPRWLPGEPEAVTEKSLGELVDAFPGIVEALVAKTGGHHGARPPELAHPAAHATTWRDLATWACSRAYRCRMGDRETAPQPGYLVSTAFKVAVRGWLADPLANGRDGALDMGVLVAEPERMWSEGRAVSS